jgi:predicted aspartyl protease
VAASKLKSAELYAKAKLNGRNIACLFDSGAVQSIIGRKLVPDATLKSSDIKLFAANGTEIKIIGAMTVDFTIEGQPMSADVVVSEDIEELILGIEWLKAHECKWDFGSATASIGNSVFKMHRRPSKACLRCIYVAENCVIPPRHEGVVPVKATWNGLRAPQADWVLETRAMGPRVVTARTLLSENPDRVGIHVVNYSNKPFKFRSDRFVGNAVPVTALEPAAQKADVSPTGGKHVFRPRNGSLARPRSAKWRETDRRLRSAYDRGMHAA